jgi:hypothetical protein
MKLLYVLNNEECKFLFIVCAFCFFLYTPSLYNGLALGTFIWWPGSLIYEQHILEQQWPCKMETRCFVTDTHKQYIHSWKVRATALKQNSTIDAFLKRKLLMVAFISKSSVCFTTYEGFQWSCKKSHSLIYWSLVCFPSAHLYCIYLYVHWSHSLVILTVSC